VAIIGAGPAGLSAAYFLARQGYHPTIFDKAPYAGGMLRFGIPDYRLPPAVLEQEIGYIKKLGVDFQLNAPIGKDRPVAGLFKEGFKAYLAVGVEKHEDEHRERGSRRGLHGIDISTVSPETTGQDRQEGRSSAVATYDRRGPDISGRRLEVKILQTERWMPAVT
jgi:NADPH-dependent 2,4-dienoyl-CoA reductase/sulfur reductase-like enzyme